MYQEHYGGPAPAKVNREMLDPLFDRANAQDLVPPNLSLPVDRGLPLRSLTAEQLFQVLETLAVPGATARSVGSSSELARYLEGSLLMEEDLDFAAAAADVFEHYRMYKQTSDAERGVCERCACPVATKMQPGLNPATPPQAFAD